MYRYALSFKPLSQVPDSPRDETFRNWRQRTRISEQISKYLQKRPHSTAELANKLNRDGVVDGHGNQWTERSLGKYLRKINS